MKGKRPDEEIAALPKAFRVLAVHRLRVPGLDDERHLVEISLGHTTPGHVRPGHVRPAHARPQSSGK
jgi:hypothetical protein